MQKKLMYMVPMFFLCNLYAGEIFIAETTTQPSFDLMEVFMGCPFIYIILLLLSLTSFIIWIYSMITLRLSEMMPTQFLQRIRELLLAKNFEGALAACQEDKNFLSNILSIGLTARKHGMLIMTDAIKAEGRRAGNMLWQRLSLLNEIAVISPMLGLLGTVIGLFFAFYDSSRSAESLSSVFDGLGIAVGTTVAGLIVAIIAMIFYTTLKFKVIRILNSIEYESQSIVSLVEIESSNNPINPNRSV